jgi:hypothetical protein
MYSVQRGSCCHNRNRYSRCTETRIRRIRIRRCIRSHTRRCTGRIRYCSRTVAVAEGTVELEGLEGLAELVAVVAGDARAVVAGEVVAAGDGPRVAVAGRPKRWPELLAPSLPRGPLL